MRICDRCREDSQHEIKVLQTEEHFDLCGDCMYGLLEYIKAKNTEEVLTVPKESDIILEETHNGRKRNTKTARANKAKK